MRLDGKVAIVTGGGSGNGQGIAWGLAHEGAVVVVWDMNLEGATQTVKDISNKGGKGLPLQADVSQRKEVEKVLQMTLDRYGKVDILVNNAGIAIMQPFMEVTDEIWEKTIRINLTTTFVCTQVVAAHMIQMQQGKIINIASVAAFIGLNRLAHYSAAKGGVSLLTKATALELAPYKINVNAIAPGIIETPATRVRTQDPAYREKYLANIPLKKIGTPSDLVGTVVYLASSDSDYVTGVVIPVDGGWAAS